MVSGKPQVYKSNSKGLGIVGFIFTMLGFLMLLGGGLWAQKTFSFKNQAQVVEGEVVALVANRGSDSTTYAPKYSFIVVGQQYTVISNTSSNPAAYSVGEKVSVLFDPSNPFEARIDSFMGLWFGPILISVMGSIFLLVGVIPLFLLWRRGSNIEHLMRQGMPVMAEYQRVESAKLGDNGKAEFFIIARWHERQSNQLHVYRSDALGFDPSEFLSPKQLITVLVNKQKPDVYYMDTSFLPQQRV